MAVKKYYKTFEGQVIEAIQDAEEMSPAEESALRNAIGGDFTAVESNTVQAPKDDISKQAPTQKSVFTSTGRFRGADYKSGVTNNLFRFRFSNKNNFKERVNFLDKNVGKEGYVVDKLGNFLLTPKGQEELSMESTNNLMSIDEDALRGEDILDLAGEVFGPTIGSIAGFSAMATQLPKTAIGRALIRTPYGGALAASLILPSIASGAGAYIGTFIDEAQQWARGISDEAISDVNKRGKTEAMYAAGGDLIFGGLLRGLGYYFKGNSQKHLNAFYGEGATDPKSGAFSKIWKEYENTGKITEQDGSMLFDIKKDILPDFYGINGLNVNLKHRLQLMAETIAGTRTEKLNANAEVFKNEMYKALEQTDVGKKILNDVKDIDKYINKAIKDAYTTTTDDFVDLTDKYTNKVHNNLKGSLNSLLKLSDEIAGGNPKSIDEIADIYNQLQNGSAIAATEAIDVGQRIAKQGFKDIQDIFEVAEVAPGVVKKTQTKRTPIELNEGGLTPSQAVKVDDLFNKKMDKEAEELYDLFLEKNLEKGLIESVDNPLPSQRYKDGEFDEVVEEVTDVVDSLPSGTIKAVDDEIKILEKTTNPSAIDANRLNFLRGLKDTDGLSVIKDKKGIPQFALRFGEDSSPEFIKTDDTIKALRNIIKNQKGGKAVFDSLEPGILKTLAKVADPDSAVDPISLLSPMQHNELVQALRKVAIADGNIKLDKVWTAAIKDGEISYAQLGSAMSSVKKKGFEGIKKGSPEYKQKMQAVNSLTDIAGRSQSLIDEQRLGYELFEEFGLGRLTQDVAAKRQNSDALINKLLSPDANPELISTMINTLEKTIRRQNKTINQVIKESEDVLPGYKKAIDENVPTLQDDIPPLTSMDEGQQIAAKVTQDLAAEGNPLAKQSIEKGRLGERITELKAIQETIDIDPNMMGESFKNALADNLLNKMTANKTIDEFAEQIRVYAGNGRPNPNGNKPMTPSTLERVLGKESTEELIKISDTIKNSTPVNLTDEANNAVQKLLNERFTELNKSIREYSNLPSTIDSAIKTDKLKELQESITKYADEFEQLKSFQDQEFVKTIQKNGFNINNEQQLDQLVNTMFDKKAFSTTELERIINKLDDGSKQEIRKRYLNNQITRALGVDVDDVPTIPQIGKIFNQDFITDLFQDPARFELIFGKESQTNFKKIVAMGKRLQTQNASGNFGQLVAATLAAAFAGLPIAVATGSIGIYAGALLAARYKGIRWYAEAMSNKKVAEAIAEPRFFTPGALNTSEKIALYQNGIMDAATQMLTETDNTVMEGVEAGQNMLNEENPRGLSAVLKPLTNLAGGTIDSIKNANLLMPTSRSSEAFMKKAVPKKQSYTPLPNVQDFRQTEDIFSEINRRRALSGNNPNTQALADRNR